MHGFICDFCEQRFKLESKFEDHWKEVHNAFKSVHSVGRHNFDGYICEICYKKENQQESIEPTDAVDWWVWIQWTLENCAKY